MRPQYLARPIASLSSLCAALSVDINILKNTAKNIERHYHPYDIPKKDGTKRTIYIPSNHLKTIQKRINRAVFGNVKYPSYLYGGIQERDYVKNATVHSNAEVLIALDVRGFYPSITYEKVVGVFQYFCKFSPDVSSLLADLTCLRKHVPQGACTSSHIANLILHDSEYHLVQHINNKGYKYTRLLDDISISANKKITEKEVEVLIKKVSSMLSENGLKLQNKKTRITSRSNPEKLMEVTGLWLNRGRPRAHREVRRVIKAELDTCKKMAKSDKTSNTYHALHNRLSGRVAKLAYLKHKEAKEYREILRSILPTYDKNETHKLIKIVNHLSKSSINDRKKYSYYLNYQKTRYRLNILIRSDLDLAKKLLIKLRACKPSMKKEDLLYNVVI